MLYEQMIQKGMAEPYSSKDPLVDKWIDRLKMLGRSPLTREGYARDVEHFAKYLGADGFALLPHASTDQIQDFICSLIDGCAHKPVSIRRKRSALCSFFTWIRRDEKIRIDNPALDTVSPKPGIRLPVCMTKDEVARLLETTITHTGSAKRPRTDFQQARDRAIMELLYASGLRRMEITRLNMRRVKIKERSLRVIGKGDKERVVLFDEATAQVLQAYLDVRPKTAEDAFFVGRGGRRLQPRQVWEIFRAFADRADIVTHATPHVMRHSFATNLIEDGADVNMVKELLGHQSLEMTGRYINISRAYARKEYDHAKARQRERSEPQCKS